MKTKILITLFTIAAVMTTIPSSSPAGWAPDSGGSADGQVCTVTSGYDNINDQNSIRRKLEKGFKLTGNVQKFCSQKIILKTDIALSAPLDITNFQDADGIIIEGEGKTPRIINAVNVKNGCAVTLGSDHITLKNIVIQNAKDTGLCINSNGNLVTQVTLEKNARGLTISGGDNLVTDSILRNNAANGAEVQNGQVNELTLNAYYGNGGLPLVTPNKLITPVITSGTKISEGKYSVQLNFNADVTRAELYRAYPVSGATTLIAQVTSFNSRTATVEFPASSGESVFAIGFLNKTTSPVSNIKNLSDFGDNSDGTSAGTGINTCKTGPLPPAMVLTRLCTKNTGSPPLQDTDCDGITDNLEDTNLDCQWNPASGETDALSSDSDDDDLFDGVEDKNRNGQWEETTETDPLDPDTDHDGIEDGLEDLNHNGIKNAFESDPKKPDSDNDGIPDYLEDKDLDGLYQADKNETKTFDADTDRDSLADGSEDSNRNGQVDPGESDPRKLDSDGDGLPDGSDICPMDSSLTCSFICVPGKIPAASIDTDLDGIPDTEEDFNHNCLVDNYETSPKLGDTDNDALIDRLDPCPKNPDRTCISACSPGAVLASGYDSDGDGLPNPAEDVNGNCLREVNETDAYDIDTDHDGIPDGVESANGTNPLQKDSDNDGINDGDEDLNKNGKVDPSETDPRKMDTDGDGVPDLTDICATSKEASCSQQCLAGQVPVANLDSDGDGIPNVIEDENHSCFRDPNETNAFLKDTDTDGVPDGIEDGNHNGKVDKGETEPRNPDSDGDGIPDGMEDANHNGFVDFTECDPRKTDTDVDGIPDYLEDKNRNGKNDKEETACYLTDSDHDGLTDGLEDNNHNGIIDAGETDSVRSDTDGDGALDGQDAHPILNRSDDLTQITGQNSGCSLQKNAGHSPKTVMIAFLLLAIALWRGMKFKARVSADRRG